MSYTYCAILLREVWNAVILYYSLTTVTKCLYNSLAKVSLKESLSVEKNSEDLTINHLGQKSYKGHLTDRFSVQKIQLRKCRGNF